MQRTADCPWAVLGLDEGATLGQVRHAYRAKAKVTHPDCGGDRAAFEALKDRADALYVVGDALVMTHRIRINTLALAARVPTMHVVRELVEVGGLMSYGP